MGIIKKFIKWWNPDPRGGKIEYIKNPNLFGDYDWQVFQDGDLRFFIEIKVRRCKKDTYKKTIVPLRKHNFAVKLWINQAIPVYLIVQWTDCAGRIELKELPDRIDKVKRNDRDKVVWHAFYEVNHFRVLWGEEK